MPYACLSVRPSEGGEEDEGGSRPSVSCSFHSASRRSQSPNKESSAEFQQNDGEEESDAKEATNGP